MTRGFGTGVECGEGRGGGWQGVGAEEEGGSVGGGGERGGEGAQERAAHRRRGAAMQRAQGGPAGPAAGCRHRCGAGAGPGGRRPSHRARFRAEIWDPQETRRPGPCAGVGGGSPPVPPPRGAAAAEGGELRSAAGRGGRAGAGSGGPSSLGPGAVGRDVPPRPGAGGLFCGNGGW